LPDSRPSSISSSTKTKTWGEDATRGKWYDFKNIFVEKIGVFDAKHCWILQKVDHNIGF
jgi:hypothetical protein